MQQLSNDDVQYVSGGFLPVIIYEVSAAVLTYVGAIDAARSFGAGLGSGFYDGINERD